MSLLTDGLKKLHLEYTEEQLALLERYIGEIELWNPRYGLVNAKGDDLITRHILDSLSGASAVLSRSPETLADVGSGAGLPGIPLAIMLPGVKVTLIERSGKRVRFLRNAAAVLNLKNLNIMEMDLKNVKDRYDLVTFRAFKPVEPGIMTLLMNILTPDGQLAAYKGRMENINDEIRQVGSIAEAKEILPLSVPGLREERHLVFYCKN
ncbi:16S rRNA (guanine(527)-N(7))-methyltransferase RsmG [Spirochaeta isovalerica]|uniref:Ribosomal RNA small subunit methyltransferase G n=1 Tax=Spirochaeta isovalerica TaxID=150 RepID=A0A841RK09_9SPIO|nr:16S rRNA (guanine(527)-N(7))-methyltransferase RsmG [Spirochaeta isovalerica]MBB6482622.1 16S rRNA (guanine527-N7)-methyltransferase [Spirochaeta isovalerica]